MVMNVDDKTCFSECFGKTLKAMLLGSSKPVSHCDG
jgi:hypothetical protein